MYEKQQQQRQHVLEKLLWTSTCNKFILLKPSYMYVFGNRHDFILL